MIKILFSIDGLRSGGKERRFVSLIKKISKSRKFKCELVCFNEHVHYKEIFNFKVKIHFIPRKNKWNLISFIKYFNIIRKFQPHLVHSWDTLSTLYSIIPSKVLKIYLLTSKITDAPINYNKNSKYGIASQICFKYSNLILSNSNAGIKSYKVPISKSKVIYNGFDFDRKDENKLNLKVFEKYNFKKKYIVCMIANFNKNKDFNTFFNAAKIVRKKFKNIVFIAVGDGPLRKEFNFSEKDGVYMLGKTNDVESVINLCDIGVLMTDNNEHGEGISNSLMEFMAFNKPVIASDNGGNSELIENNISGIIIKENNPELLAAQVINLVENKKHRELIGFNAGQRIKERFSIDIMFQNFISIYNQFK